MQSQQSHRKDEHVFLAEKAFDQESHAGFDQIRFIHTALPEMAVSEVTLTPELFDWQWPFYINAMTGGSKQTGERNAQLGRIAAATGLAIATGSQSVALADHSLAETFQVMRRNNPGGFILGNLGAGKTWADAKDAIAMIDANALEIHLNVAQELVMPEGDRDFHWLDDLAEIVAKSPVPILVKEVGFGMSQETLAQLQQIGVQYVDIAGRGGTNFATIENYRRETRDMSYLKNWGQTTTESLLEASTSDMTVLATGGVRNPLDILTALRLGARAVGISGTVLHSLIQAGEPQTLELMRTFQTQLAQLMTLVGARDLASLRQVPVVYDQALVNYAKQRHLELQ